jgi:hypothetical protein
MRVFLIRSLSYVGLCAGLALLTGCATTARTGSTPEGANLAAFQTASGDGLILANATTPAPDDEFAVDAGKVTSARAVPTRTAQATGQATGSAAPKLNVLYVTNGRIRATGSQIVIRGTVEDDTPGVAVTVNGLPAIVKDRSFQRRIAVPLGESEIVVRAEDSDGNVTVSRFALARAVPGQSPPAARPPAGTGHADDKMIDPSTAGPIPRIEDIPEAGVYMVLMEGTAAAHFVKMPNMAKCQEAVEFTANATCTQHRGSK